MDITVKTTQLENATNGIVGLATVTFGDQFKIRGIKVVDTPKGFFVDMPSYKSNEVDAQGKNVYKDVISVTDATFFEKLKVATIQSFYSGEEMMVNQMQDKKEPQISAFVTLLNKDGNTKALARLNVENLLQVNNVSVREGNDGNTYVSMPSYKTNQVDEVTGKNVYRNYCYVANKEFSEKVNSLILNRYRRAH